MGKIILVILAGLWIVAHIPKEVTPQNLADAPVRDSTYHAPHKSVEDMSDAEFNDWVSKQNPHDPPYPTTDTVVQYPLGFRLDGSSGSSNASNSASTTLNSGDATFTGTADDSNTGSVYTPGAVVPVGYHVVKSHYTKTGHLVKAHYARNRSHKSSSTRSSSDWSQPIVSRSVDMQQRRTVSQQNFPSVAGQISKSDPTVILGQGY